MWYFAWILGLGFALTFGILNGMWNEVHMSEHGEEDLEIDGAR